MKQWMMAALVLLMVFTLSVPHALAEGEAEQPDNCLPEEGFSRYSYVEPDLLMPDVESVMAVVSWNFQCSHDASVEVADEHGNVVRTISASQAFSMGDNQVQWDGRDDSNKPVPDGMYTVIITPLDEFAEFATEVRVEIKLFKYPSIYGIFGDELKDKVKQLP